MGSGRYREGEIVESGGRSKAYCGVGISIDNEACAVVDKVQT